MSEKTLWQNLKVLVDCDRNIIQTEATVTDTRSRIEKNTKEIAKILTALEVKKSTCARERKNVALLELQATEFKTREDEKKAKLNNIKDQRELKAIEKELQALSQQSNHHDDILVQSWQSMEQAIKSFDHEALETERKITTLQAEIVEQDQLIKKTVVIIEDLIAQRAQAATSIPEEWLTKYNRMKHSLQDPIVPVHGLSCSSCFYTIIKQDYANLKKVGMLPCRSCYRLLYIDTELDPELTKNTNHVPEKMGL